VQFGRFQAVNVLANKAGLRMESFDGRRAQFEAGQAVQLANSALDACTKSANGVGNMSGGSTRALLDRVKGACSDASSAAAAAAVHVNKLSEEVDSRKGVKSSCSWRGAVLCWLCFLWLLTCQCPCSGRIASV